MKEKIIKIITETLNLTNGIITETTEISDIENWDSMMQLMILSELQEQLGLNISIEDAIEIKSVADFLKYAPKE